MVFNVNNANQLPLQATNQFASALLAWAAERTSLAGIEGVLAVGQPAVGIAEGLEILIESSSLLNATENALVPRLEAVALKALCSEVALPCNITSQLSSAEPDVSGRLHCTNSTSLGFNSQDFL